jgi:hypothetical protein
MNDIGEVEEAIFQDVEIPCQIIFCFQGIQKSEMDEFSEVMFQVCEWH